MLRVNDLSVSIGAKDDFVDIVSSVSLAIDKGEILGLVGESGVRQEHDVAGPSWA